MNNWERKHYDLTIKHGQVLEYKIPKSEKIEGRVYRWESPRKKVSFRIVDRDAGKSAELMRYLMEWDGERRSMKSIIMIILSIAWFVLFFVVLFSIIWKTEETTQESNLNTTSELQREVFDNLESSNNPVFVEEEPEEEKPVYTPPVQNPVLDLQNDYEIQALRVQILQKDGEYSILNNRFQQKESENQELVLKNQELVSLNENLLSKVRGLELELVKVQKEASNDSWDEFLIYLGGKLRETCEKALTDEKKASCSDLYYNFLK